jgi:hypothetical protein
VVDSGPVVQEKPRVLEGGATKVKAPLKPRGKDYPGRKANMKKQQF